MLGLGLTLTLTLTRTLTRTRTLTLTLTLPLTRCVWSRPFASAPVLAYHVDRVTGALQQLDSPQPLRHP